MWPTLGPSSHHSAEWLPLEILIQKEIISDKDDKGHAPIGKGKCLTFSHSMNRIQFKKQGVGLLEFHSLTILHNFSRYSGSWDFSAERGF